MAYRNVKSLELFMQRSGHETPYSQLDRINGKSREYSRNRGMIIPLYLTKEIERFVMCNVIATSISSDGNVKCHCCPNCLKAHILKTAEKMRIDSETKEYLKNLFPHEVGHLGYYADKGELIKI